MRRRHRPAPVRGLLVAALLTSGLGCVWGSDSSPGERPPDLPDLGPPPDLGAVPPGDEALAHLPPPYPTAPTQLGNPVAVLGGSLLVTNDARTVAADPARDRIYVTGIDLPSEVHRIYLQPGDEPWRLVEDAAGRVHVTLRRGGALVTLDPELTGIIERRDVCSAPRGVAYDPETDAIVVACAGGELVTFPAAGGPATDRVFVADDLRDVIITSTHRYVTRFRAAELLTVDRAGTIVERRSPLSATISASPEPTDILPNVAWRAVSLPSGGVLMLHQRSASSPVRVDPSTGGHGYGGTFRCPTSLVQTSLTSFPAEGMSGVAPGPILAEVALAVDLAVGTDGTIFLTTAGSDAERVLAYPASAPLAATPGDCQLPIAQGLGGDAIAPTPSGDVMVLRREPAALVRWNRALPGDARPAAQWLDQTLSASSVGRDLFHEVTGVRIACASCHPEGSEDGHTWRFEGIDPRRTQTLLGGVLDTAPFHWSGDQPDLRAIMTSTFEERMRGERVSATELSHLGSWLDAQPSYPAPERDTEVAARGAELFVAAGCASCHAGEQLTNNESVELSGFGAIQVPMLVGVAHRSPWLHDGCAQTLSETFDGGCIPEHVPATPLTEAEATDLVAYLRSL